MTDQTPAGWHIDPFGRHERRYWDGSQWTQHVDTGGHQGIDQPIEAPAVPDATAALAAAGWHIDPFGRHERRYWDGNQWTQHVDTSGRQEIDQPIEAPAVPDATAVQPAAGWHPNPTGNGGLRYWDGNQWTQHVDAGRRQEIDQPVEAPVVPDATAALPAAGWHPDPTGNGGRRYWDGNQWTQHFDNGGHQEIDTPSTPAPTSPVGPPSKKVARQARKVGAGADQGGGGTLFTEQVLVINQKARVFRSTSGYAVYSQNGHQIGTVEELRRHRRTDRHDNLHGRSDSKRIHRFRVVDMDGRALLEMTRPQKGWLTMKGTLVVEGPGGVPIGQIVHETFGVGGGVATAAHAGITNAAAIAWYGLGGLKGMAAGTALGGIQGRLNSAVEGLDKVGHARFGLEAGGKRLGSIHSENIRQWDFTVKDPTGTEIARITKTWAGWAKERFTKADNYVVQMHRPLEDPVRSLVIAAALAIDVELKQEGDQTRGSSVRGTRRYK